MGSRGECTNGGPSIHQGVYRTLIKALRTLVFKDLSPDLVFGVPILLDAILVGLPDSFLPGNIRVIVRQFLNTNFVR